MKCVNGFCSKNTTKFKVAEETAIVPAECEVGMLRQLFSYFQYRAPNIDSLKSPMLDIAFHEDVLAKMTKGKPDFHFCSQNANTEEELKKVALEGVSICSWCKRFMCKRMTRPAKRDSTRAETDLECFLRHLRNSIAHGHVFVIHGENYINILFDDVNTDGNITARIVCCQADLRKWRNELERALDSQ